MIRIATIDIIDCLVKFRIQLLKEVNKNIENYNWNKYFEKLKYYYLDAFVNGKVVAFLAEESGKIVAVSIMCFYNIVPLLSNLEGTIAFLSDMYTIPEYRNRGIGIKLLKSIMEYTKKLGYAKVVLNATDAGRKFYKKYGFKDIEGEMSYKYM